MCQHHYFSLIINEKEWKNTHRNRCAELSLRLCVRDFFFFAQSTIVQELWSSEKGKWRSHTFIRGNLYYLMGLFLVTPRVLLKEENYQQLARQKIPNLGNVTQIISGNMSWQLSTPLRRGKSHTIHLPTLKFILSLINIKLIKQRKKDYQTVRVPCARALAVTRMLQLVADIAVMLHKSFDAIFSRKMKGTHESSWFKLIVWWPDLLFPGLETPVTYNQKKS